MLLFLTLQGVVTMALNLFLPLVSQGQTLYQTQSEEKVRSSDCAGPTRLRIPGENAVLIRIPNYHKTRIRTVSLIALLSQFLFNWLPLTMAVLLMQKWLIFWSGEEEKNIPILLSSGEVLTSSKMSYHKAYTSSCLYGSPIVYPRSLPNSFQLHSPRWNRTVRAEQQMKRF